METKRYNNRHSEAKRLGVSIRTLDRRVKEDGFPFIRFGGMLLFDPALSDAYLAERTYKGRTGELARNA